MELTYVSKDPHIFGDSGSMLRPYLLTPYCQPSSTLHCIAMLCNTGQEIMMDSSRLPREDNEIFVSTVQTFVQ